MEQQNITLRDVLNYIFLCEEMIKGTSVTEEFFAGYATCSSKILTQICEEFCIKEPDRINHIPPHVVLRGVVTETFGELVKWNRSQPELRLVIIPRIQ